MSVPEYTPPTTLPLSSGEAGRYASSAWPAGTPNAPVTLTSYEGGLSAFGEDADGTPGMSTILSLLFENGASTVVAVSVEEDDYASAFAALKAMDNIQIVVCDSGDETVQQDLRTSLEEASATRRERIAVVGMSGAGTSELTGRAEALSLYLV